MSFATLRPVDTVDFGAFTATFNLAYRDYYVPISMTPDSFRALMERDDLSVECSVVALDGNKLVGTGLLGLRPPSAWIGGMGVIPEYRRRGIARQMIHYLLDRASEHDIQQVRLEVIESNDGAHSLYRAIGFEDQRSLMVLDRSPNPVNEEPSPFAIESHAVGRALSYYHTFHDVDNCWQRAYPSLLALAPHAESWLVFSESEVVGYGIGWANDFGVRILDIAANPSSERTPVAKSLLAHLHQQQPGAHGTSYNIADNDPIAPAFAALGYTVSFRQIEMGLDLSSPRA